MSFQQKFVNGIGAYEVDHSFDGIHCVHAQFGAVQVEKDMVVNDWVT